MTSSLMVRQVFNFEDGRTVLAGLVEGDVTPIRPGRYGLHCGHDAVREVVVEGDMIPRTGTTAHNDRAVSIADALGLPSGEPRERLTLTPLGQPGP